MRKLSLPEKYQGIIAWDSFFHLNPGEQRTVIGLFLHHLAPRGALLLTIGDKEGEVLGKVNGQQVYHSSLAPQEYTALLLAAGFRDLRYTLCDPSCGGHSVLLASQYVEIHQKTSNN
jgi:hypothetical protein